MGRAYVLTLFTVPKAFTTNGHIADIQHNAIASWKRLTCVDRVLVIGDDPGVAEAAAEHGVDHEPQMVRNEYGTPLINEMFASVERYSDSRVFCYVNADIMLLSDFSQAVEKVLYRKRRFLMVGRRTDYDQVGRLDFSEGWEPTLRQKVSGAGRLQGPPFIDFFVYTRRLWGDLPGAMPPLALGRCSWDNWLIYRARSLQAPLIDATAAVVSVHQNHDYAHAGGTKAVWHGPEAKRNLELSGGKKHLYTVWDATHELHDDGLRLKGSTPQSGLGGGVWSYRRSAKGM